MPTATSAQPRNGRFHLGPLTDTESAAAPPSAAVVQLLQRGWALHRSRDFAAAAGFYARALQLHPNQPDALRYLAKVGLAAGETDDAVFLLKRAERIKPSDSAIQRDLGAALLQLGEFETAGHHLKKAIELNPDDLGARVALGKVTMRAGDPEGAKRILEEVLTRQPDHKQAGFVHAQLCIALSDFAPARRFYRSAWQKGISPAHALAGLATCETLAPDSPEAIDIERQLKRTDLTAAELADLSRAAGAIADRAGRYDEAFHFFADARRLGKLSFDMSAHRAVYQALKELFTPGFFAERRDYGHPSDRPVFIVGMPRSGTTLTEQIITSHPETAGGGEMLHISRMAERLDPDDPNGAVGRIASLTRADVRRMAEEYLELLDRVSPSARRVTDKLPHNYENLGLIALMFPNAKIVHSKRDPRDTCVSCFTNSQFRLLHPYTDNLETLGAYYREYVGLMDHWRTVLPIPTHESNYEALVGALEERSRALIEFIGLEWDPACLAFHESTRPVLTASQMQVRRPLYLNSVARWRNYEKHLGPLINALGDLIPADETKSSGAKA
jgi:tetratricopeptide (TPR) repeat protein